jgi:hypothetical protein
MEFIKELFIQLLGVPFTSQNMAIVIAGAIFANIGLAVNYFFKVKKAIKTNDNSPDNFSIKYFIKNNWQDISLTILLVFVGLRFTQELLGLQITMWVAFIIGFGIDKLVDIINSKLPK